MGGEWEPQTYRLRDSYVAIGRAMEPIVAAQGTDRLFVCIQEEAEARVGWAARGCDVLITYHDRDGAGRGMIIQRSVNEFLLVGTGFAVQFRRPRPDRRPVSIAAAEWGRFDGDRWGILHPMRREHLESRGAPVTLREPGVVRVVLDA